MTTLVDTVSDPRHGEVLGDHENVEGNKVPGGQGFIDELEL